MNNIFKRKWNDFYGYVVYQGQQDYYKYPIHKRIFPAIEYVFMDIITFPIKVLGWFYMKYLM